MQEPNFDIQLIKIRKSTRTYDTRPIEADKQKDMKEFISDINHRADIKARFLLTRSQMGTQAQKMGTYGVISGADFFIVGIIDKDEQDWLRFGYLFELIVLHATGLGLDTCWMGGTFNRGSFEKNTELAANEFIPVVSPLGYRHDRPKMLESAMRALAGSDQRKPWKDIFYDQDETKGLTLENAGDYAVPLEMVRLAPSASNKQPWRIVKVNQRFDFYLARTPGYGRVGFDIQKTDAGIAQCHFELTARELGLNGHWKSYRDIQPIADWEYMATWERD